MNFLLNLKEEYFMVQRTVIGSYTNRSEALATVNRLKDLGYEKQDITLYTNSEVANRMGDTENVDVSTETAGTTADTTRETRAADTEDDRSFWDQIKDVFSSDTYDYDTTAEDPNYNPDEDVLYPYRDEITSGNIVVVVDNYKGDTDELDTLRDGSHITDRGEPGQGAIGLQGERRTTGAFPEDEDAGVNAGGPTPDQGPTAGARTAPGEADEEVNPSVRSGDVDAKGRKGADTISADERRRIEEDIDNRTDLSDNEKIRLKEERLEVDKQKEQTGEVDVKKETVHDTETVEVPVEREEVVVERKPVAGDEAKTSDTDFNEDDESISIPVREDKVNVDKESVVTEEVNIKKETQQDVEEVSEDVRREELDVDAKGDTRVEGSDENIELDEDNRRKKENKKNNR